MRRSFGRGMKLSSVVFCVMKISREIFIGSDTIFLQKISNESLVNHP